MNAGGHYTVRAFESAYPGSMFERKDGYYVERNDHKSMAAALVELISSRDRELDDLRDAIKSYQRLLDAAPYLMDAAKHAKGCFDAAEYEGFSLALQEGDLDRVRDIWSRRISRACELIPVAIEKAGGAA
ncbi:MAG: hypothetical protein KKD25_01710 [Gammaproteobacteria bacterium]|jgi:hypothetical protein|nr:hypothetical protein [Gammaproteobacteria bacterium]MBU0771764.1 hypothetical protein [Gammaproteobacteria bacterium]MBU0855520.1 hypothetical protein [Gammaproteobacteria bacterium]MBU1846082.1 hypothetical protein [Gammaproteobacteria bacterium]